ncbi:MAG TPA: hypothetical protein VL119_08370 [Acidimicrobiia bacterium]|nr:hypothetical protein [Acidimicrobiia bacterium]
MVRSRRARNAFFLLVAGVCVSGLTGCGGSRYVTPRAQHVPAPSASTVAPTTIARNPALQWRVQRAAAVTTGAGTARVSVSVTVTGAGDRRIAIGVYDVAAVGVVDFATGDASLQLSAPVFDRAADGGRVEQRSVHGVVYTRVPVGVLRAGGFPPSVRWLSFDPRRAADAPSALVQPQVDPTGPLEFLAAISAHVRRVGTDSVRGWPTTHYASTVDVTGTPGGKGPKGAPAALAAALAPLGPGVTARAVVLEAWLDGRGRARRVVVSIPLETRPGSAGRATLGTDPTLRIQGDFYAFGVRVGVVAPPRGIVRSYRDSRNVAPAG